MGGIATYACTTVSLTRTNPLPHDNPNPSSRRIHSYRGIRHVTVTLDEQLIFKGEVSRACGGLAGGTEAYGDTILFTEKEEVLEKVAGYDQTYQVSEGGPSTDRLERGLILDAIFINIENCKGASKLQHNPYSSPGRYRE